MADETLSGHDLKMLDNSIKVETMRQMKTVVLLALLGLVAAAPVSAGDLFFGAKTGSMIVDSSAVKTDPTNVGILVGYELGLVLGDLALEGELTTTTSDGKYNNGTKFDLDTIAAYLAFRTAGPVYLKAKGGFLQVDGDGGSDTGASYGIGIGFGIGIAQLELEYTQTAVDPDLAFVSVGVQF
ncbi:MAG: outer membrane beta-barrel protein [Gammaproteobacteria bacterium]|nr:outer membrane beta-barrel protein [Gammaproteobacteria bacterium]